MPTSRETLYHWKLVTRAGENRRPPYTDKNPAGQIPCLELDDGSHLAEITAICEYLEEIHPQPPLIGSNAEERAETRMWTRRIDLGIVEPMANGFRFSEGLVLARRGEAVDRGQPELRFGVALVVGPAPTP